MQTERQQLAHRFDELKTARNDHDTDWRAITDQVLPYRARWTKDEFNKSKSKSTKVINSTPTRSLRIFAAGLMAGITSPSRPWFQLVTSDSRLNEVNRVKSYLEQCRRIIRQVLLRGRWYQSLADGVYRDLGMIANAAMWIEESDDTIIRCKALPIGEYYVDVDHTGDVDTLFREIVRTARQLVLQFGYENVSPMVRKAYDEKRWATKVEVIQAIYPNDDWQPNRADIDGKRWLSKWWEKKAAEKTGFLHESGYWEFPLVVPRWNAREGEVYGRGCPGWETRGDCLALQHLEERLQRLVDKTSDPPMKATNALKGQRASLVPGDMTYLPHGQGHLFEPAQVVDPRAFAELKENIARHEQRIKEGFYVDLWLAMLNDPRNQRPTATEVEATRDEIMLQLGPLLENLNDGLLDPGIARVFAILQRRGLLPDPPEEVLDADITIEYVSVLHQAQKMTAISSIRELLAETGMLAELNRVDAVEKLNADAIMDELADILGVRPELVLSDDQVNEIRRARAEREQAQQQGEAMLAATQGVKNLSGADPQQLSDLATIVSPAAAAQGGLT
jgi:hypothetical protein